MKSIAPAVAISAFVTFAIARLISLDGGVSADDAQPAGTACDIVGQTCSPSDPTQDPAGGMDAMSIDMDPSSDPANTATSIGSREFCARINDNGVLDADEDNVDALEIDVTTGPDGIPENHPMLGFEFTLRYDPAVFTVVGQDVEMLLSAISGAAVFNAGDTVPDSDGSFLSSVVDAGSAVTSETGPGVLSRITLASHGAGGGLHHLVLEAGAHIDTSNHNLAAQALNHAVVAIDTDCPDEQPEPVTPPIATPGPQTPTPTPTPTPSDTGDGRMDAMSIDMDPSSAPANTATIIGSREFCARINDNGILDADEDDIDALDIDVTTGPDGIPDNHVMAAFSLHIRYPERQVSLTGRDTDFLLASIPGSNIYSPSQPLPDSDGSYIVNAVDFGVISAPHGFIHESGPGVLARLELTAAEDADPGVMGLSLSEAYHLDPNNDTFFASRIQNAFIAVDAACPAEGPPAIDVTPTPKPTPMQPAPTPTSTPTPPVQPTQTPTPTPPQAVITPTDQPEIASETPGVMPQGGADERKAGVGVGDPLVLAFAGLALAAFVVRRAVR